MHEFAALIELGMQEDRLNEQELQYSGTKAGHGSSDQPAGQDSAKHCLVTGKAVGVTHVVGGIVQCICLNVACQHDDSKAEKNRREHSKVS